ARVELSQTAGGQNDGLGLKRDDFAVDQVETHGPEGAAIFGDNLDDGYVANTANITNFADLAAQRGRHRRTGVEKIDIAAATTAVARCHFLFDVAVFPRPARAPLLHFQNAFGAVLTEQRRQLFVAKAAT